MAVEAKRGCGFRKVGGLYLVCGGAGRPCDRLPFPLHVCNTCGQGIKQARGWTWVNGQEIFGGNHKECKESTRSGICVVCNTSEKLQKAGLLWTGGRFYKTPDDFMNEANTMGVSRRIKAVPKDFKLGETWVLMAHPKAIYNVEVNPDIDILESFVQETYTSAIFTVFKPSGIELIIDNHQAEDKQFMEDHAAYCKKVGVPIKTVVVPADDPDHQGTVYDREEEE